jgi:hypothetical protein
MTRIALSLGLGLLLFAAGAADAGTTSGKLKRLAAKDPANNVLSQRDTKLRAEVTPQPGPTTQDHCVSRY